MPVKIIFSPCVSLNWFRNGQRRWVQPMSEEHFHEWQSMSVTRGSRRFPRLGLGFGIHFQNLGFRILFWNLGLSKSQIAEPWLYPLIWRKQDSRWLTRSITWYLKTPRRYKFGLVVIPRFFFTFFSIFSHKINREFSNLEHALPKCVPERRFEILWFIMDYQALPLWL